MNLRHFILTKHSRKSTVDDDEISSESGGDDPSSYYYLPNPLDSLDDKSVEPRREIHRIPTFAVFHKLAPGKGIPHTFVGESYLSSTTTKGLIHVSRQALSANGLLFLVSSYVTACLFLSHILIISNPLRYSCRSAFSPCQE